MSIPKRGAINKRELDTLFPSPTKQIFLPSQSPRCSLIVSTSARAWHGCSKSVSPLITGTSECLASSTTSECLIALIIIPSTKRLKTLAVSDIGSPLPICKSLDDRKIALPPNWYIPTSNETLVRVDDF